MYCNSPWVESLLKRGKLQFGSDLSWTISEESGFQVSAPSMMLVVAPAADEIGFGSIVSRLSIVLVLVLLNAFFVAAEFALVGSRRSRIDQLAQEGDRRAKMVQQAIIRLDRYISATQLGITLASLGLGWIG